MKQRSEEERVQELQAKIDAIRERGQRKKARANPVAKFATAAVKAIDKAAAETHDATAHEALADAREPLSAWLALQGLTVVRAATDATNPKKGRRKKSVAVAAEG